MISAGLGSYKQVVSNENAGVVLTLPAPGPGKTTRIVSVYVDTNRDIVLGSNGDNDPTTVTVTLKEEQEVRDTIVLEVGMQHQQAKNYATPLRGRENTKRTLETPAVGFGTRTGLTVDYFTE